MQLELTNVLKELATLKDKRDELVSAQQELDEVTQEIDEAKTVQYFQRQFSDLIARLEKVHFSASQEKPPEVQGIANLTAATKELAELLKPFQANGHKNDDAQKPNVKTDRPEDLAKIKRMVDRAVTSIQLTLITLLAVSVIGYMTYRSGVWQIRPR